MVGASKGEGGEDADQKANACVCVSEKGRCEAVCVDEAVSVDSGVCVCVFPKPIHLVGTHLGTGAMAQTELIISLSGTLCSGVGEQTTLKASKLMPCCPGHWKIKPRDAEVRGARSLRLRCVFAAWCMYRAVRGRLMCLSVC